MNPRRLDELETYLESRGVAWERLSREDWSTVVRQWIGVYGRAFRAGMGYREGAKAVFALSQIRGGDFWLFSITNEFPSWKSSVHRPRWGYRCRASTIPELGEFCDLDFVMVASDFSWTMAHTHEDFALGGPYFAEKDWVVPPTGELGPGRRRGKPRRRRPG